VAAYLAEAPLAAIYTSPLLRARQTTAVIAAYHPGVPVRQSALLLEIRTSWQGTLRKDVPKGTSFYVERRHDLDETEQDVLRRMQRLVAQLRRRHAGQTVLCVSHADPIAVLTLWAGGHEITSKLLQQPLAPARGAITVFEYRAPHAPPVLTYVNPQDPEPPEEAADEQPEGDATDAPPAEDAATVGSTSEASPEGA
jgi:broad specificity phosphatase PhoE